MHNVFHVSLLKKWTQTQWTPSTSGGLPELESTEPVDEDIWDTERLLRWRCVKKANGRWGREFLVLFRNRPADEL